MEIVFGENEPVFAVNSVTNEDRQIQIHVGIRWCREGKGNCCCMWVDSRCCWFRMENETNRFLMQTVVAIMRSWAGLLGTYTQRILVECLLLWIKVIISFEIAHRMINDRCETDQQFSHFTPSQPPSQSLTPWPIKCNFPFNLNGGEEFLQSKTPPSHLKPYHQHWPFHSSLQPVSSTHNGLSIDCDHRTNRKRREEKSPFKWYGQSHWSKNWFQPDREWSNATGKGGEEDEEYCNGIRSEWISRYGDKHLDWSANCDTLFVLLSSNGLESKV